MSGQQQHAPGADDPHSSPAPDLRRGPSSAAASRPSPGKPADRRASVSTRSVDSHAAGPAGSRTTDSPNPSEPTSSKIEAPALTSGGLSGRQSERIFPIRSVISGVAKEKGDVRETDFARAQRWQTSPRPGTSDDPMVRSGPSSAVSEAAETPGLVPLMSPRQSTSSYFSSMASPRSPDMASASRGLTLGNLQGLRSFPAGDIRSPGSGRSPTTRLSPVEEPAHQQRRVSPQFQTLGGGGGYFAVRPRGSGLKTPATGESSVASASPQAEFLSGAQPTPESTSTMPSLHQGGPHNPHARGGEGGAAMSADEILERGQRAAGRDAYDRSLPPSASHAAAEARPFTDGFVTARFEHMATGDGHMVLTGRKGELRRCEDEPIHMPGAIQAFGVLLAVLVHGELSVAQKPPPPELDPSITPPIGGPRHPAAEPNTPTAEESSEAGSDLTDPIETIDISQIEVVQCSENSGHLLGLSPKKLLSLDSLTDIFDEHNAKVLIDNVEALFEGPIDLAQSGPSTFRISGEGSPGSGVDGAGSRNKWTTWCAAHRPDQINRPRLVVMEFELENDQINPASTDPLEPIGADERGGLAGEPYQPTTEDLKESTKAYTKPLKALARLRRKGRDISGDSVEVMHILTQINEQFDRAPDLSTFLKMVVSVVAELTGFHRVMIYQFDEMWNGLVVAELVDWKKTRDLYRGLHFPATDIPAQARELYKVNKVRMLYDRDQPTARLVCRDRQELEHPLDMTHAHLRAMSPIHIKYLVNMGVRASFSISIISDDRLWGLISCHSYGRYGHRVTFPTRQFCRMLGNSISRTIDRLTLAQRLHSRKLINTTSTSKNPSGYIVAKAEDLLWLFDADFGVLSIGDEAKILGPLSNSQEVLIVLEYLRVKNFDQISATTDITASFPDINYPGGFKTIAGLMVIPLSRQGRDFICFFRQGQLKHIHWAGNPYQKIINEGTSYDLEPRKSFKLWSETVMGKSKPWSDEQMETAGVLCLVYGKFIDVWRQKEAALQTNQLQTLLLSNASHEVRTPLNAIINYLEMALEGQLDQDTRDNLFKSYNASRALVHVINDLLDLTRTEQGKELYLKDPFSLSQAIEDAVGVHRKEAERKGLAFAITDEPDNPQTVLGDRARIRQVVGNLVANAVKHTEEGRIAVHVGLLQGEEEEAEARQTEGEGKSSALAFRRLEEQVRVAVTVTDTGCGIAEEKLEAIFRAFEQVDTGSAEDDRSQDRHLGLGLAVVGRVVHMIGGQLRVESEVGKGSKFTAIFPFGLPPVNSLSRTSSRGSGSASSHGSQTPGLKRRHSSRGSLQSHGSSQKSEIDGLVEAISTPLLGGSGPAAPTRAPKALAASTSAHHQEQRRSLDTPRSPTYHPGQIPLTPPLGSGEGHARSPSQAAPSPKLSHVSEFHRSSQSRPQAESRMRVLVVEDDTVNRMIISKKLMQSGHEVKLTVHGLEAVDVFKADPNFDIILMDLQMPICDGFQATKLIREHQHEAGAASTSALPRSHVLNGAKVPILAVSASLRERQKSEIEDVGMDGWITKPVDFSRLAVLMEGAARPSTRSKNLYVPGDWDKGGWLTPSEG